MPSTVLDQCFHLRHPSIPGVPPLPLFCQSVCYATKLADNRKELHIKNPKKPVKERFIH